MTPRSGCWCFCCPEKAAMGFSWGAGVGKGKNGSPYQPGAGTLCPMTRPIPSMISHYIPTFLASHIDIFWNIDEISTLFFDNINIDSLWPASGSKADRQPSAWMQCLVVRLNLKWHFNSLKPASLSHPLSSYQLPQSPPKCAPLSHCSQVLAPMCSSLPKNRSLFVVRCSTALPRQLFHSHPPCLAAWGKPAWKWSEAHLCILPCLPLTWSLPLQLQITLFHPFCLVQQPVRRWLASLLPPRLTWQYIAKTVIKTWPLATNVNLLQPVILSLCAITVATGVVAITLSTTSSVCVMTVPVLVCAIAQVLNLSISIRYSRKDFGAKPVILWMCQRQEPLLKRGLKDWEVTVPTAQVKTVSSIWGRMVFASLEAKSYDPIGIFFPTGFWWSTVISLLLYIRLRINDYYSQE